MDSAIREINAILKFVLDMSTAFFIVSKITKSLLPQRAIAILTIFCYICIYDIFIKFLLS